MDGVRRYEVPCEPPWWARGGHAQTVLGHFLPSRGERMKRRSRDTFELDLEDDERILVFRSAGTTGVRVHLFHGLSGDVNSEYMRRTAAVLRDAGHDVWAVNHRGAGEGWKLAREPYHSGKYEDMQRVLEASREDAPDRIRLVVGFSLSGNQGLLLGADPGAAPPHGIVAVNPPADLARASHDIGRGFNRAYERRFVRRLRKTVRDRRRMGFSSRDGAEVTPGMSLCEFDDRFTAPECGFESGADYYERSSGGPRLEDVRVPTVIVTAEDDPFVDPRIYHELPRSEHVFLHVEPSGGHVGYVSRGTGITRRWLDGALSHYVEELGTLARSRIAR